MRLFTKIFLFGMLVFGAAFSVSGYFLLHYSLESSMAREVDFALNQFQYDKFRVQSAMLTYTDVTVVVSYEDSLFPWEDGRYTIWQTYPGSQVFPGEENSLAEGVFGMLAGEISVPAAFYAEDKSLLYSQIEGLDLSFLDGLSKNAHVYRFQDTPAGGALLVGCVLDWEEIPVYFVTQWDISKTMHQQDTLRQYFFRCYLAAMGAGMVLLGFLSAFLTKPLKRMTKGARRMADGDYRERFVSSGRDEIGELALSFNQMADAVEEKIEELEKSAREKEDFVANFAHELKTPLTSIIGYADTIYQKELPREETRRASWHIWNEGMRLEALSLKLMELTVLGRQTFPLEEMPAHELLEDVAEGLEPLFAEKQIAFELQAAPAYVRVDYDLFKTLLINLMDNSRKAGSSRITLCGCVESELMEMERPGTGHSGNVVCPGAKSFREGWAGDPAEGSGGLKRYRISVTDNGCGMEEKELSRITEAFYMVDKARSRKQHGAGLGLALADRIARIHGSRLSFESTPGQGTRVSFWLECAPEDQGMEDGNGQSEEKCLDFAGDLGGDRILEEGEALCRNVDGGKE